jgi:hypothetical protein
LSYDFSGAVNGDNMSGLLNLGEYGLAEWSAERHHYDMPDGQPKPVKKA